MFSRPNGFRRSLVLKQWKFSVIGSMLANLYKMP